MITIPRPDQIADFAHNRMLTRLGSDSGAGVVDRIWAAAWSPRSARLVTRAAQALHRLDTGTPLPWDELRSIAAELLAAADGMAGHAAVARRLRNLAVRLMYHRTMHAGATRSPLMHNNSEFIGVLRSAHSSNELLVRPDSPIPSAASDRAAGSSPLKVLILCHSSWTFIDRVQSDLAANTEIEFRTFDVSALPLSERPTWGTVLRQRDRWNTRRRLSPVPKSLAPHLAWADVAFVEWGAETFAWFSFLDLTDCSVRAVARIHRYETLTPYPMLVRGGFYDAVCFVTPALRRLMETSSPRLAQTQHLPVVHNVHDFTEFFAADSPFRDRFALVQVGWSVPVKDVLFSLDVLEHLRARDPRFHLRLIGRPLSTTSTAATRAWADEVESRIEQFGSGVREEGFRDDIPEVLAQSGFLLSSSVSEGTHESVAEAAAAGCIPVVRNWPDIAPWGGAQAIYPAEWTIGTPAEAAERILALVEDAPYESTSASVRRWVQENRREDEVRADYVGLLKG
ncbi:glycosyltransferase [Helcobacillus massiliensis]|uniref:Glycosyltransferase involved in cell wall biosynthesis n=1 Tax=Helcobacillus massiliensis TaxID=521392 RepID=A0A839QT00_9MICO|nr:glycosyltransferase [Helcobacillus massiliensis]MBB3021959.1 glycosyltransferase involved in cell wall biosynthesis [Helcobacillus massiliensis]